MIARIDSIFLSRVLIASATIFLKRLKSWRLRAERAIVLASVAPLGIVRPVLDLSLTAPADATMGCCST